MTMQRHFDEELQQLKNDILKMGALAQEAIINSVDSLKNRDKAAAQKVLDADIEMDRLELFIDDKCLDLIALHQPMARDLRFITTAIKLNAELERIGDLAVDGGYPEARRGGAAHDRRSHPGFYQRRHGAG